MLKGQVQTVLGSISPDKLGLTLCHEHTSICFNVAYVPSNKQKKHMEDCPISLETVGWLQQNRYSHPDNLTLLDAHDAVEYDLKQFQKYGGCTIVENSTHGLQRDVSFCHHLSKETGVNIVLGTGYYVAPSLPTDFGNRSQESLVNEMTKDLLDGIGDTNIKCGVIGEIGCSWPLHDYEIKSLRATGQTQENLGCPVIIHPGRNSSAPEEIARILQEAGGNITKTVMSHLDRTFSTKEGLLEFASTGCYCEHDLFGMQPSIYALNPSIDFPSDAEKVRRVKWLLDDGYRDQVLIAHDIHTKDRLTKYGGHGYVHILENIVPLMELRGIDKDTIDHFLIENPKRWLSI